MLNAGDQCRSHGTVSQAATGARESHPDATPDIARHSLRITLDRVSVAGAARADGDDAFARFNDDLLIGAERIREGSVCLSHVLFGQGPVIAALDTDGWVGCAFA